MAMSQRLEKLGVFVTAIRPPTVPRDSSRLRITFSAGHTLEQVNRLLEALSQMPRRLLERAA
jgi:8-amino-7-oxononanoate synthase